MLASAKSEQQRYGGILRVLWITLVANWAIAALKIVCGILARNTTLLADGLHSLADGANNILGIVTIRLASRPPDEDHPYGHRRFENIAATIVGIVLGVIAWELFLEIVRTVVAGLRGTPRGLDSYGPTTMLFVGLVALSMLVNLLVARYELRKARALQSGFLAADSQHTFADAAMTALSLLSLLTAPLAWWVDPLLATGVLVFLVRTALHIITQNLSAFTGKRLLDPDEVQRVVDSVERVVSTSDVRSQGTTTDTHLDVTITVAATLSAAEVTAVEREVCQVLRAQFPYLTRIGIQHHVEGHEND